MQGQRVIQVPALIMIGFWIVLQLFSGFASLGAADTGGVAYMAHIGGFAAGLCWPFCLEENTIQRRLAS